MSDPIILEHVLAGVLAVFAVYGLIRGQGSMKEATLETRDKLIIYWLNGAILCLAAGATLAIWHYAGRSFAEIGLRFEQANLGWAAGLTAAFVAWSVLEADVWTAARRARTLARLRRNVPFLPETAREARHFTILGTAAGVTEEIIARGFAISYLTAFTGTSTAGVAAAVALPGIAFAAAHRYQGWKAVIKIVYLSLTFGAIFVLTKSLLIPIILHIATDVIGGWSAWWLVRGEGGALPIERQVSHGEHGGHGEEPESV